jgi:predicted phage-related endonuclease
MTAREEWLEARKSGLGGSDMGAILGLSPWASAYSVFTEKIGLTEGTPSTERMAWGNRHERTISKWYAEQTGRQVAPAHWYSLDHLGIDTAKVEAVYFKDEKETIALFRSKERPWMMASIDDLVCDPRKGWGVLEIKCAEYGKREWMNGPPKHYEAQIQAYLALTGLSWGSFAVMFSIYECGHIDVERDESMIARILEAGDDMARRIRENDPPEIDGSEASRLALAATLGKQTDETIALPIDAIEWDAEYIEASAEMKAAEKRKKCAANKIHAAIGDASFGALPSGVLWKAKTIAATANKREHRRYTRKEPE